MAGLVPLGELLAAGGGRAAGSSELIRKSRKPMTLLRTWASYASAGCHGSGRLSAAPRGHLLVGGARTLIHERRTGPPLRPPSGAGQGNNRLQCWAALVWT